MPYVRFLREPHFGSEAHVNDIQYGSRDVLLNVGFDGEKIVVWCGYEKSYVSPFCDGIINKNKRDDV